MNNRQKIIILLMDIFIFIELTYSIIQGKKDFENMTAIFFLNFIPMFLLTYILAKVLVRRLETAERAEHIHIEHQRESSHDINTFGNVK